jgi:hypothetical protein
MENMVYKCKINTRDVLLTIFQQLDEKTKNPFRTAVSGPKIKPVT